MKPVSPILSAQIKTYAVKGVSASARVEAARKVEAILFAREIHALQSIKAQWIKLEPSYQLLKEDFRNIQKKAAELKAAYLKLS